MKFRIVNVKYYIKKYSIIGIQNYHSMNFGLFYGTFCVEVGNFSGPKLEGKNTTA